MREPSGGEERKGGGGGAVTKGERQMDEKHEGGGQFPANERMLCVYGRACMHACMCVARVCMYMHCGGGVACACMQARACLCVCSHSGGTSSWRSCDTRVRGRGCVDECG